MRRFLIGSLIAISVAIAVVPGWTGHVRVDNVDVPLPSPSLSIGSHRWILIGRQDLAGFLSEAAAGSGWVFGEQLGSMCTLRRDGYQARVTWGIVASVFTRVHVTISPAP